MDLTVIAFAHPCLKCSAFFSFCFVNNVCVVSVIAFSGGAVVDLYNNSTGSWSTAQLSVGRSGLAAASVGILALFAGGEFDEMDICVPFEGRGDVHCDGHMMIRVAAGSYAGESSVVDLFNCLTQTWSTAHLSVARTGLVAASVGSIALFAGGQSRKPFDNGNQHMPSYSDSSFVDVFHVTTGKWSNASLSVARKYLAATTVGDVAVFAGGEHSDAVDLYQLTGGSTFAAAAAAV